ncbi:hypothetical protein GCM10010404_44000 [Nonomuraea africana]|uniref:Transposase n=1 Tax=Nonomuraea africana TaxID=46171 RepID=A0ABR9KI43_9ACTN|nr:transposase [Nonomuraea africana]
MKLRYNYRLYPDAPQRESLARTFGCVRAVWNDALARRKAAWKADRTRIGGVELQKMCITAAKRTPEREWLGEVSPVPLQQSLRDLDVAYKNFFESVNGKRRGPKMGLPVFKSRHDRRLLGLVPAPVGGQSRPVRARVHPDRPLVSLLPALPVLRLAGRETRPRRPRMGLPAVRRTPRP